MQQRNASNPIGALDRMDHDGRLEISRRQLLRWTGAGGMLAITGTLASCAMPTPPAEGGSDENGLVLPDGFTSRVIALGGVVVTNSNHQFPIFPDGAATFADAAVPGGWYYVVNHEVPFGGGGVTSIRFAPDGSIVDAYPIAMGTTLNCAGGPTPWGTWLTCEEYDYGKVYECDPAKLNSAVRRDAMGVFPHEAAAVASDGRIYLTEDKPTGAFYRFTPTNEADLSSGLLEVACGDANIGEVTWKPVPDPSARTSPCREQVAGSLVFKGGEGIDTRDGVLWFTTKGDNRVWQYDTATAQMSLRYQGGGPSILSGVDNLFVDDASGTLFIAEDGGDMQLVMIRPDDTAEAFAQILGHEGSEITGPTFSPDGQRLYFSSQRGPVGAANLPLGVTYEVTGPFDAYLGRAAV